MEPDSGSKWIERDANGRYMFVRKRAKLPSTRSMLADAFGMSNNLFGRSHSRSRSRSFPRAESEKYLRVRAPVRNPPFLALPAPPLTITTPPTTTMNTTPESGNAFIHDTGQYSQPPLLNDPTQQLPYPHYPSYTPSYPGYYLAPNPAPAPFHDPYPPLPPGARILSPPRAATADELKYKCSICGKFRSPRFHYKHPIPPGQLPAQTVCRKCRQTGTDSEDTSDEKARLRGLRRSRSVVSIPGPIRTRMVSDDEGAILRRRSSRVEFLPRSRSRIRRRLRRRSTSSSSSLDLGEVEIWEEGRHRRARSRSVGRIVERERVRYVDESPPLRVSPPRETIYIDDDRDLRRKRASRFEEDYYTDYESEEDYLPRRTRRTISREPSLIRVSRRQYSEPVVREHVRFTTQDYFDGPNSVYEESTVVEGPRAPSNLPRDLHVLRVSEDEAQRIRERLARSDEYELVADRPILKDQRDVGWYEDEARRSRRERRRRRRSRSRSRSRMNRSEEMDNGRSQAAGKSPDHGRRRPDSRYSDYIEAPRIRPNFRAPTPPPADRRRLARHPIASRSQDEDIEVRRTRRHEELDRDGRPVLGGSRLRSRSKSRSGSRWDAPFGGRPPLTGSDAMEMQGSIQGPPPAADDYDWYDSHGQRVRVREI